MELNESILIYWTGILDQVLGHPLFYENTNTRNDNRLYNCDPPFPDECSGKNRRAAAESPFEYESATDCQSPREVVAGVAQHEREINTVVQ
jgi:hypothetical protein